MKKITPTTWSIVLALLALAALLILAASLNGLVFRDGKPMPMTRIAPDLFSGSDTSSGMAGLLAVLRGMMIFMWVLLPFYLIYLIISKEARKRLLRDIMMILPIIILLYIISNNMNSQKKDDQANGLFGKGPDVAEKAIPEPPKLPEFQPPAPWVTTVTSLVLALATVALVSFAVFMVWKRTRHKENEPLHKIEREARDAIDSLEAGGDLREVIQRCYLQMVIAMRDYRMIRRDQDVTPHEFEQILAKHGMPDDAVHQLTELFERVRYGGQNPGSQEEHAAKSSLSAIISACQRIATRANY